MIYPTNIQMNKKSQVEIILLGTIIVMLVFGAFGSYNIISQTRYIGDSQENIVYDLKYCEVKNIPKNRIITFETIDMAYKEEYHDAKCNKPNE